MEVGIENFNLAYEARNCSNITILGAPGRYGINDLGGGLNTFKNTKINNFWACEVAGGDTWISPVCIQGNNGASRYGFVLNNLGGNNPAEGTLTDMIDDSENSGNLQTQIYVLGTRGADYRAECDRRGAGGRGRIADSSDRQRRNSQFQRDGNGLEPRRPGSHAESCR